MKPGTLNSAPVSTLAGLVTLVAVSPLVPGSVSTILRWTWEGGESFESSPIIAGGVVYIGAGNGDLVAIELATGKTKWKYKTGAELEAEVATAKGAGK